MFLMYTGGDEYVKVIPISAGSWPRHYTDRGSRRKKRNGWSDALQGRSASLPGFWTTRSGNTEQTQTDSDEGPNQCRNAVCHLVPPIVECLGAHKESSL